MTTVTETRAREGTRPDGCPPWCTTGPHTPGVCESGFFHAGRRLKVDAERGHEGIDGVFYLQVEQYVDADGTDWEPWVHLSFTTDAGRYSLLELSMGEVQMLIPSLEDLLADVVPGVPA